MTSWSFDPVGGPWLLAALAAVLLPLLAIGPNREQSRGRRVTLTALRAVTMLLLFVALLRPSLETTETRPLPGTLLVLGDVSRSMSVEDSLGNESRFVSMKNVLRESQEPLAELDENWDFKAYAFDEQLTPLEVKEGLIAFPDSPDGNQTAIGAALDDVLAREAQQRLVAVLLMSDGAQRAFAPRDTPPQTLARRLAVDGVPLYTFTYGKPALGDRSDVRMSDLLTNDTTFAETPATVSGVVTANGYQNQPFTVQLLWEDADGEMQTVDTQRIEMQHNRRQQEVKLTYTPNEPGEYKVTLRVEPPEGELVTANNEQTTFVTVQKGGVKVLYLAGADRIGGGPNIEARFVRNALSAHADLNVNYELLNYRNPQIDYRGRLDEGKYDVLLLGNVDSIAFDKPTWDTIAKLIDDGTGLAMLGGFHSFGPGGYRRTSLERVLPIRMGPAERQNFNEPPRSDMHLPAGPVQLVPVGLGGTVHPILQIGDNASAESKLWSEVPALDGGNQFDRLRLAPNAQTIAEADNLARSPLIVLGAWGEGRTAALAFDSTWHWQMEGYGEVHRRFWRQLVLWLAKKDDSAGRQVWAKLDGRRYQQGNRVEFTLGARDTQSQALAEAEFDVQVEMPDGSVKPVRTVSNNRTSRKASFAETSQAGDYRILVSARAGGESLGTTTLRFSVTDQDVELDQPAADPTLMAALSKATAEAGGEALAPEELPELLERLKEKREEFEEEIVEQRTLWDTWPMLIGFVGLLGTEWFLRKKWGMV
ncbi:glutamine amidotransferase [Adhaeretor mobilis]|uniref:Putative glutamine amidotransferase domain-containing protein n=1 Tax=Adhaeretor mobilis TaxID=1930276 RepID=A0A517N1T2_9BACT|nr:glutamine amidotransferase [Adhaeretor mobilis]QDT01091.1 hypothetical protein HG15A2_44330 [Adhaeretor mobilis]